MMTLEIHPEELLDKAAAGTLTESERVWLDGHLAQCQVCRFERQARADFAAVSIDDVNVDALVSRALVGAQPAAERPGITTLESRRRRRSVAILAGTALVFSTMASFAAVAQWTGVWPKIIQVFIPVPTPAPAPAPTVKKQPPPVAVQEPKVETVEVVPPPAPEPMPVVVAKPVPAKRPVPVTVPATPEIPVAPAPTPAVVAVVDASQLFDRANRARVQGQREAAISEYRALLAQFPSAPEANLTRATLGRLLLDSGDATGGLFQLDAYLRTGDLTLREEVLTARAQALARLGRASEEAAAWKALLDGYPGSIHATRAQARLEELGKR